jgi:ankyrin repeat protein
MLEHDAISEQLIDAVRTGDVAAIRQLATKKNVDAANEFGDTAIIWAAYLKHTAILLHLLNTGANPYTRDKHGNTAIILAARRDAAVAVTALLAAGANPNTRGWYGNTALIEGAAYGSITAVQALLAAPDIELNIKNEKHQTATEVAIENKHPEIARLILSMIAINKKKFESCISDNRNFLFHTPRDIRVIVESYLTGEDTAPKPNSSAAVSKPEGCILPTTQLHG